MVSIVMSPIWLLMSLLCAYPFTSSWIIGWFQSGLLWVSESCSVVSDSLWSHGLYGILQTRILEWVAIPFFSRSPQPRDQTYVSYIAGRFFTSWATREAQEYWSGQPIPSPADLLDPEIKLGSPALQVDSLPTEPPGKPIMRFTHHE